MSEAAARRERVDSCTLSFIAGFVDTCVFVGLFGLFTAHVTGNLVLIGAALVQRESDVLAKLLALPVFVLAVAVAVRAADALRRSGRGRVAPLLCAQAVLLLLAVATIEAKAPPMQADEPLAVLAGMFAAAAMALQNALMRLEFASLPSSTVMTVNVTQVAIDATILAGRAGAPGEEARRAETHRRFARMWPPILAFTLGAACGAAGYAWTGLASLALPAALCFVLALRFGRRAEQ